MSVVTLAKVRELAPHLPGDDQGDLLLKAAIEFCESYCNRKFDRADVTNERGETVREDAGLGIRCYLYVRRPPVFDIDQLILEDGGEPVDGSLYEIDENDGKRDRLIIWENEQAQRLATTIDYTGGWTETTVPTSILMACAIHMGVQLDRMRIGLAGTEASGGESVSYNSDSQALAPVRNLLNPYRILSV